MLSWLVLPALYLIQQPSQAELSGRVTSRTGVPLSGVELTVLRDSTMVTTDSAGRFVLRPRPGDLVIRVRRIGYLPQYLSASLRAGEKQEVTIAMVAGAYQLPEVEVIATAFKPIEYGYTMKYDEFFRRKHVGLGHYISREDIDRRMASETSQLLMGIPGVRVIPGAPGVKPSSVRLRTCERTSVWVDGVELKSLQGAIHQVPFGGARPGRRMAGDPATPGEFTGELLERLVPLQIEMIEVYTGPSQMPAEAVGNSCAAIMIWTR